MDGLLYFLKLTQNGEGIPNLKKRSVVIHLSGNVYIYDSKLSPSDEVSISITSMINLKRLIDIIDACSVCTGNNDEKYMPLVIARKGNFMNITGS